MIDLRPIFLEATRNVNAWRQRYSSQVYPHKIVVNMMYRAYSTRAVFKDYKEGNLIDDFDDFMQAAPYVQKQYENKAMLEVRDNLLDWMQLYPDEQVGTICTSRYEALATRAETDRNALEELEFSYIFETLSDQCVLYFIAFKLCCLSDEETIAKLTNYQVEISQELGYTDIKSSFYNMPFFIQKFLQDNYIPLK